MFSPTPPPFSLLGQRVCSSQTPSAPVMEIVPMRFSSPFRSALSRIGIIPGKISLVTHMTYPCAIGESMFSVAARTGSELARGTGVQESFLVDRASSPKHPSLAGAYRISGVETISAAMKKIIGNENTSNINCHVFCCKACIVFISMIISNRCSSGCFLHDRKDVDCRDV